MLGKQNRQQQDSSLMEFTFWEEERDEKQVSKIGCQMMRRSVEGLYSSQGGDKSAGVGRWKVGLQF